MGPAMPTDRQEDFHASSDDHSEEWRLQSTGRRIVSERDQEWFLATIAGVKTSKLLVLKNDPIDGLLGLQPLSRLRPTRAFEG